MTYKVICGGIIRANGQLALYGTILDEGELDDPTSRVKEGYVEAIKEKIDLVAKAKEDAEQAQRAKDQAEFEQGQADSALAAAIQAEKDAADQKAANEKAEIEAQAQADQKDTAGDLLAKTKAAVK